MNIDAALAEAIREDPVLAQFFRAKAQPVGLHGFVPRPDNPAKFDQQHAFCYSRDQVAFLLGGNAAGTTEAAAFKAAKFLLQEQPPPRRDTPFWVLSNTYDQSCGVCWGEKLFGHEYILEEEVDWDRISWVNKAKGWPSVVPLRKWPGTDKNWRIEFKSYEQGREALQARSIGGFWFSEQFPQDIFLEVLRGCREYMFLGGQFAEFTPIEADLSVWIEHVMENMPAGWAIYRANTELNRDNLAHDWFDTFFATVPEEMFQTRMTGALASFEGVIYPSFFPAVHVVEEAALRIPPGCRHRAATDWGSAHPHVTIFGAKDGKGKWYIYDEYFSVAQSKITRDHVKDVLEIMRNWGWPVEEHEETGEPRMSSDGLHYGSNFADPSRPGEIEEFARFGVPTVPAVNNFYFGVNQVRSALKVHPVTGEPGIVISNRCTHLIEELRKYRWNPKNVASPAPLKINDDAADALRYLLASEAHASGVDIEVGSRRSLKYEPHSSGAPRHGVQLPRRD